VRNGKAEENEKPRPPNEETPFDSFSEFARKVVAVPKPEIEAQERRYKTQRRRSQRKNS
jgi:hypothetical protein